VHWDVAATGWRVEAGTFRLEAGHASDDLPVLAEVRVTT
jgi:hypothetical protein